MLISTTDEQRWRAALATGRFGVWDLDPRLEKVHYSPAWKLRLGFPDENAADRTSFWRCRVHPDDLDPMIIALRRHLDGFTSSYQMQFRLRSNGSGYRTMLSRGRVVERDQHGNSTRMLGTMVDRTGWPATPIREALIPGDRSAARATGHVPLHRMLGVESSLSLLDPGAVDADLAAACPACEKDKLLGMIDDLLNLAVRESGGM
jgi:hypothetical protein